MKKYIYVSALALFFISWATLPGGLGSPERKYKVEQTIPEWTADLDTLSQTQFQMQYPTNQADNEKYQAALLRVKLRLLDKLNAEITKTK